MTDYPGTTEIRADVQKVINLAVKERFGLDVPEKLEIMLCMDGRNLGKRGSQHSVLICIALLNEGKKVHAFEHLYPLGLNKSAENYDAISQWFPALRKRCEAVTVNGKKPTWYVGGDLKALLILCGMPRACSKENNCLYGDSGMDARRKMDHKCGFEGGCSGPRADLLAGWIPRSRVVIDILHLLLRVYDCLFERSWETLVEYLKSETKAAAVLEPEMIKLVRSFRIYTKESGAIAFSSLNGTQRLKVLSKLQWSKLLPAHKAVGSYLDEVFTRFHDLYKNTLNVWQPEAHTTVQAKCEEFIRYLVGGSAQPIVHVRNHNRRVIPGRSAQYESVERNFHFTPTQVMTCYMHYLYCHMGHLFKEHGGIKRFGMQNLELHNNTDGRKWFCCSSRRPELELREMFLRQWLIISTTFSEVQENNIIKKMNAPYPLHCDCCGKGYKLQKRLQNHYRSEHPELKIVDAVRLFALTKNICCFSRRAS